VIQSYYHLIGSKLTTVNNHLNLFFKICRINMKVDQSILDRIKQLKEEKDVVILSHYYMPKELQWEVRSGGFVDFVGDSLGLSVHASQTQARNILFCGVQFMAETALLVNPTKKVFMPDPTAGCSLASSISGADIRNLREQYPGVPIMGYINTYAETKAELDICCTSRNAIKIAASLPGSRIIFVPDMYMGQNLQVQVQKELGKHLILWNGSCEVHQQFRAFLPQIKNQEEVEMLFHWEVPGEVTNVMQKGKKGIVGSTGDILKYVSESSSNKFYLASECDLGVALQKENADKEFITPCLKCPHMKLNSLEGLLNALEAIGSDQEEKYGIYLDAELIEKASIPVKRMLAIS
jgi:quinolinate synthase